MCWAAAALRFGLVGGGWWFCWTGCRGRPRASARSRWSAAPARGPTLLHRPELGSGCRGGSTRFATLPDVKMIASRPNHSKAQLLLLLKNMDADTNYWQVSKRLWEGKFLYILTEMPGYWENVYMIYLWKILARRLLKVSLAPLLDKRLVTRLKRKTSFICVVCTGR